MYLKFSRAVALFLFISATASNAQSLSIGNDGVIQGSPIHRTENTTYYDCREVVGDRAFVQGMFDALTTMSNSFGVAAPRDSNCVVSQSFIFGNLIAIEFFINNDNARCFYRNFCNDTRSATLLPVGNEFEVNLMLVNADTQTTAFWCLSNSRGFLQQHCRE